VIYQRRASPLHAARASAACAWVAALVLAIVLFDHPVVLGAELAVVLLAAAGARSSADIRRYVLFALLIALPIMLVNALVSRHGVTVIARLGDLPLLGHTDVTLEAVVYGGVLALRVLALVLLLRLYSVAVDPDEVLRLFRRVSFRSALTATLATRMVPVLMRDSRRLAEAQRCRAGASKRPPRIALLRATTSGALDRAIDVAAALEVRGYGSARRAPRSRRPWSRHDLAFCASGIALTVLAIGARVGGLGVFSADGSLHLSLGAADLALVGALTVLALAPFLDRRGIAA
jgi:energy-coupling factor transport system permease protein